MDIRIFLKKRTLPASIEDSKVSRLEGKRTRMLAMIAGQSIAMHLRRILHGRLLLQLHQLQCQKKQRLVKFMLANMWPS